MGLDGWARRRDRQCKREDLPGCGILAALLRQTQFFQPFGFLAASPLLRFDGFLGGSLGVFEAILPISL